MNDLQIQAGIGIAGNFTGHLEQAGEANDFVNVAAAENRPKGVFPWYLPGIDGHFLSRNPMSATTLELPADGARAQTEPEMGVAFELTWDGGTVTALRPLWACAFDDTSLRIQAPRISLKKNWGEAAKGVSATRIPVDTFAKGGILDRLRLACFLVRDEKLIDYGIDSAVRSYNCCHEELIEWVLDRLANQKPAGPLEDVGDMLLQSGKPACILVACGATRYTDFGETADLEPGDESIVILYDETMLTPAAVREMAGNGTTTAEGASILRRLVVAAA